MNKITGYASVFNVLDQHGDKVMPGAFVKSLAMHRKRGRWPPLLWQHGADRPIGRITDLREDGYGLRMEAELSEGSQAALEAAQLLKDGVLDGLSIGFKVLAATKGKAARLILEAELWEVSVVTFPANDRAIIGNRG